MKKSLQNFSIQKRLLSILLVWIIILVAFGTIAIVKLQQLAQVLHHMYDYPVQVSKEVRETQVNTLKIQREMRDIILSNDIEEIRNHEQIVGKLQNEINTSIYYVKNQTSSMEVKRLESEIETLLNKWTEGREEVVNLMKSRRVKDAADISQNENGAYVIQIEEKLNRINSLEGTIASNLMTDASKIESSQKRILIFSLIILGNIAVISFILIIRSIVRPIEELKKVMNHNIEAGELLEATIKGNNELVDMSYHFNLLISKLRNQFWMKNGQNELNEQLSGNNSLDEVTKRTINFLGRFLEAGNGVFYLYNEKENNLYLAASFAFTEKDKLHSKYDLGEGIIGQVAIDKKAILLRNVTRQESLITTGTVSAVPLNLYAYPLIYEDTLYGVIELSSLEPFTSLKKEFLEESSKIISINLYSVIQNEKIKNLLWESEEAKVRVEVANKELQKSNAILEDQQELLQQQTEELQKTNAELEEQQQLLEQQSEELQQSNAQLEEQQQLLEEQSKILNVQNKDLENSKEELIKRTKELESTNRYKSEFLANMSHELRTPLNSIILLSKLLSNNPKGTLNRDYTDKISVIHDSGKELLRLINDILDLSKIESGKVELNITTFNSSELKLNLKNIFDEIAEDKKISFLVEDYVNKELTGDKDKISQILRNLISNALKFTEAGYVTLSLNAGENNGVVFSVTDTGIGIRYEQLHMIFEEFQQGDGSISRRYGGTGLGLSISKKLARLMGGSIEVESQEKIGSKFTLSLPNLIKNVYKDESVKELVAFTEEEINLNHEYSKKENYLICRTDIKQALNLNGKKILIVDDDHRNIFVLASALEEFDAEVFHAENGQEALERLREIPIDLVLMDIMMPVMDGYEAIRAIRRDEKLRDLPIIALTAKSLKEDKAKCISVGADDYISKPVDYDVFVRLVKAWIGKKP